MLVGGAAGRLRLADFAGVLAAGVLAVAFLALAPRLAAARGRVYYDDAGPRAQEGFRGRTAATWVRPVGRPDAGAARLATLEFSEAAYWALFEAGVVGALADLPRGGDLRPYADAVLAPAALPEAARRVRAAAAGVGDGPYDWVCGRQLKPRQLEYRIRVPGAVVRENLETFAAFLEAAAGLGLGVRLSL